MGTINYPTLLNIPIENFNRKLEEWKYYIMSWIHRKLNINVKTITINTTILQLKNVYRILSIKEWKVYLDHIIIHELQRLFN